VPLRCWRRGGRNLCSTRPGRSSAPWRSCATIDPSQLLFERYVMTETFALFAVALMMVALTHVTIRGQWLWMLPAVIAGTVVVALRMSMLPVVLACLAGAPLLALLARTLGRGRRCFALAWLQYSFAGVVPGVQNPDRPISAGCLEPTADCAGLPRHGAGRASSQGHRPGKPRTLHSRGEPLASERLHASAHRRGGGFQGA